jgi:hypothetical protein
VDDASNWVLLSELLEELGMSLADFKDTYPHLDLTHSDPDGQPVVDRSEIK